MKLISHTILGISCTLLLACTPFNSRQVSGANQSPGISSAPEAVQGSNTTTETKTSLEALSAPIPGDDAWLQLQKLNTGAVQVSWTAATSTSTQAEVLYSVYMHKADGSSFDTVGTVEAGEKLVADQSSTQYTIKNLADSQSYEVNVIAKDKSGARSVYRPMSFSILAQVRSLDFTKELLAGQNLEFTAKDFTEHYVSRQARPLKSIRILSLPNNASLMLGSRELTLGETIEATNLYQLKLNFKSGSWTGDSSFEWQASDGSASSLSAGLVTARRLLSNISGFGQSKPVRANPLTGQISVRTFSDWPTGFTPGFTWNFQGAAWDGHYIWSTPRAGPMFVKIDTRTGAMSSRTDYPSGFSLNVNGMASAIFDGDSIWALPLGANAILRIGKDAKSMTMLNNYPSGYMTSGLWMHSGIFDGTKIWAAPCSANSILSIDKSSLAMTLNPIGASGEQSIARCSQSFFDGRYLWTTPNIESWGKTDVLTGQAAPALMSPLVQNHMIDGENIWAMETNLAAIRKTKISTGEVTRYFDWTGGGTAYPGSGCVFYDGRYYWTHTAPSIVQFDTQSGKGIGNYTLPSFINPAVQTSTRGCIFDGENLWLIPISGTMVYKISASRPSTSPSEILLAANKTFNFDSEIFKGAFHDPNQLPLARIIIQKLPQHGRLSLGKTALQAGAVIAEAKLNELSYLAQANYQGPDSFLYRAANANDSSSIDETLRLRIGQIRSSDGFGESGLIPRGAALPESVKVRAFKLGLEQANLSEQNFAGAVFDGGSVWLLPRDANQVLRIDRESGKSTSFADWPAGFNHSLGAFRGGVSDGQKIWLVPDKAEQLVRLDQENGAMQAFTGWPEGFVKQAGAFSGGVFDGQRIWLVPAHADRLITVDPSTGKMHSEAVWPLGFDGNGADKFDGGLYDGQSLWLIPSSAKSIVRVDHDTGVMQAYNNWPQGFAGNALAKFRGGAFDGRRLWLAPRRAKELVAVNRDSGEMTSYGEWPKGLSLGPDAFAGAVFDGQSVWLIPHDASHLVRINPESGVMSLGPAWPNNFKKSSASFWGGLFDGEFLWLLPSAADQLLRLGAR